ncbi:MAG: hypothetical protein ACI8XD_001311 [Thermoproteota archaeon]|jgi:hypothetical protein
MILMNNPPRFRAHNGVCPKQSARAVIGASLNPSQSVLGSASSVSLDTRDPSWCDLWGTSPSGASQNRKMQLLSKQEPHCSEWSLGELNS